MRKSSLLRDKSVSGMSRFLFVACFAVLLLGSSLFISCENFLNGSDLREKIEDKIEYEKSKYIPVQITSEFGNISPNGIKSYKRTDWDNLFFTVNSDYQFIRWQIWDAKADNGAGRELENGGIITIDDIESINTTFTLENTSADIEQMELCIKPLCIKRPKVVSASPLYDTTGVYRDRKITIMFDQRISAESIYYSSEEIEKVEQSNQNVSWLGCENKFYGYYLNGNKDSEVYKCVSISKLTDQNVNLLKYYGEPVFDNDNTGVLRIPTLVKEDADFEEIGLPPAATEILVSVKTNFGVNVESTGKTKTVSLPGEYAWSYYTNSKSDNEPPVLNELKVHIAQAETVDGVTNYVKTQELGHSVDFSINRELVKAMQGKTLWVSGVVSDGGSGPKSLTAKIYKHKNVNTAYPYTGEADFVFDSFDLLLDIAGPNGTVSSLKNGTYDSSGAVFELDGLKEPGIYKVVFTAIDKNELQSESEPYYFIYDEEGPNASDFNITMQRFNPYISSFSFGKVTLRDIDYFTVTTKDITETEKIPGGEEFRQTEIPEFRQDLHFNYTVENDSLLLENGTFKLIDQHKYEYTFVFYDWVGNASEPIVIVDNEGPVASTLTYSYLSNQNWKKATSARDKIKVKYISSDDRECSSSRTRYYLEGDDTAYTVSGLGGTGNIVQFKTSNRIHTITLKEYDYSGNETVSTITLEAYPAVGMIYYSDGYWSKDYDSTRTPEGVICKVDSGNKFYIWDIWDQYGYCWGNLNLKIETPVNTNTGTVNLYHMDVDVSGISVYDTLLKYLGEEKMKIKGMSRTQAWTIEYQSPTIWSYVLDKNKETKPVDVKSEKWFIPSRVEIQDIVRNLETLDAAFDKILKDTKYSSRERINSTDYAYRQVKLIEVGGYYWTSMLHWYTDCGAPVTFQKSGALSQNDLWWLGFYDDTSVSGLGSHKYKGDSIILYQSSLDGEKSNELFYMDRCIRRTVYSSALTAEWEDVEAKDMKTHAMALITLNE